MRRETESGIEADTGSVICLEIVAGTLPPSVREAGSIANVLAMRATGATAEVEEEEEEAAGQEAEESEEGEEGGQG